MEAFKLAETRIFGVYFKAFRTSEKLNEGNILFGTKLVKGPRVPKVKARASSNNFYRPKLLAH